jgi:acetyl esterase/lipase
MRNLKILSFLLAFLACSFLSQAQETKYKTLSSMSYTTQTDSYSKERCKLDVYYPENKKDFITVIWFHGGGLTGGNKEIPNYLKEKNIAVVGVGYRFSPQAKVADIIEDAADAVKWTFDNIPQMGGSKKKIVVAGYSAGAYLTLMLGLNQQYLNKRGLDPKELFGLVSFSAQTITHFTARKEKGLEELHPTIDELAPLYWVRKDIPRLLLLTGGRDFEMMGRYEENAYLLRMLKLHGNTDVELYELEGYGHNMDYPAYPLLINVLDKWSK